MNKGDLYIKAKATPTPIEDWVRPSDWLPMPVGITETDQIFVGLHAIIENSDNFASFRFTTSSGQYEVDWGDGTITLHNSNTIAQHQYNFNTYDTSGTTITSRGYKQTFITVTPVSGNLLTCDFQTRFVTTPIQNQAYSSGFLDCILSMPNASSTSGSITFGGTNIRHSFCERFELKSFGNAVNLSLLFNNFTALESVILPDTTSISSFNQTFVNCTSLKKPPFFNTSNSTSFAGMFQNCPSLIEVPHYDTSKATSFANTFNGCSSLKTIPLLNSSNVTSMTLMFGNCFSLQSVPLLDTSKVTNMSGMFNVCRILNHIPPLNTSAITTSSGTDFGTNFAAQCNNLNKCDIIFSRTVSLTNGQLSREAIVEIFNNLVDRSATTPANINISGNWGATALTTGERNIALNKNWTITG